MLLQLYASAMKYSSHYVIDHNSNSQLEPYDSYGLEPYGSYELEPYGSFCVGAIWLIMVHIIRTWNTNYGEEEHRRCVDLKMQQLITNPKNK